MNNIEYLALKKKELVDNCKLCKGTNSFCECGKQFHFEVLKNKVGIPIRFRNVNLTDLYSKIKSSDQKAGINVFLNDPTKSLLLTGGQKLLRTSLACCLLIEFLKQDKSCKFMDLSQTVNSIAGEWFGEKGGSYKEIVETDVMVFNDVGDERRTESKVVEDIFDNVLKERFYRLQKTIISSSLSLEEIASTYTKNRLDLLNESLVIVSFPQVKNEEIFKDVRK